MFREDNPVFKWFSSLYLNEFDKNELPGDDRSIITFPKDMQFWEVTHDQSSLPQTVKSKRKGSTLIIENPADFQKWLGQSQSQNWLLKFFKRK
jgi:hypothetical protein